MRKNQSRKDLYQKLLSSSTKSQKPISKNFTKTALPKLKGSSPNFLRLGCPTEVLIHIPHFVAVLSKNSQKNLTKSSLSIKDLIKENPPEKIVENSNSIQSMWKIFDSIKLPISSFSEIKIPTHTFSIDSLSYTKERLLKSNLEKKIQIGSLLKPLSTEAKSIKDELMENYKIHLSRNKSPYFKYPEADKN